MDSRPRTSSGLLQVLGLSFGLAVSLGGMIGSGIFRTPGEIVHGAGTIWIAVVLIVAGGVQSLLSANLWAEVSTSIPLSGGTVVVIRRAFGDTTALIAGWTDAFSGVAASAQLSVAGAGFIAMALPSLAPRIGVTAAALTVGLALVNWRGIAVGQVAQIGVTIGKAAVIAALIAAFLLMPPAAGPANFAPSLFHLTTMAGLLVAYQLVYGAYVGWATPGYFSEETKDIGRSIPQAMFWSIFAVAGLYLLMLAGLAHALPLGQLSGSDFPAGLALAHSLGPNSGLALAGIALVTVISCNNANFLQGPRTFCWLWRGPATRPLLWRA